MRRLLWIGLTAVLALSAAGIAVAAKRAADAQAVTATFSATAAKVKTWTCANAPTTQIVHGTFTGTAASADTRLAGPLSLHVHSSYDSADGIGVVRGTVRFSRGDDDGAGAARLYAVNKGGKLEGVLVGALKGPRSGFLGNFTADFSAAGFAGGAIGSGGADNAAVVYGGSCKRVADRPAVRTIVVVRRGTVDALSASSITIKPETGDPVTCSLTSGQSERIGRAGIATGTRVEARCVKTGDAFALASIKKKHR